MLSLHLLGGPQLIWNGEPVIKLTSAKSMALLFYLALSKRPHSRLEIGGLLWPDKSDEEARGNLRQSLLLVKKAVPGAIDAQRESVVIHSDLKIEIDVERFSAEAEAFLRQDDPTTADLERLSEVAELYQGPFLDSFFLEEAAPYDEWRLVERARLHQLAVDLFERLVDHYAARRQTGPALIYARKLLALDPLREETHATLMKLHLWDGNTGAAISQYKAVSDMLSAEFDLTPSPETEAIYRRVTRAREVAPPLLPSGYLPIVNRVSEIRSVNAKLYSPQTRLVTLTGEGGMGKTRTALAVAEEQGNLFVDGVVWVDLDDSEDAEDVVYAIAAEVDCRFSGSNAPARQLQHFLREREMLLILDNFEQLMHDTESPKLIGKLLRQTRDLKILITSRVRLGLQQEQVIRLQQLPLPTEPNESLGDNHSVALFTQAAQQLRPDWTPLDDPDGVRRICRLLEGHPLGLQMAAGLIESRSCTAIADALETNVGQLELESIDLPERHQSLKATFNYSYELLDESDRNTLVQLSIFNGSFTADAAAFIAHADLKEIQRLISRSLVRFDPPNRYAMHATVRQLAAERMTELDQTLRERLMHYYLKQLIEAEKSLVSEESYAAGEALQADYEHIRQAWFTASEYAETELVEAGRQSLESYFDIWAIYPEGLKLFDPEAFPTFPAEVKARLSIHRSRFLIRTGNYDKGVETIQQAFDLAPNDAWVHSKGRAYWADILWRRGEFEQSAELSTQGLKLAEAAQLKEVIAHSHFNLGVIADLQENQKRAMPHLEKALAQWRTIENHPKVIVVLNSLGIVATNLGKLDDALMYFQDALDHRERSGEFDTSPFLLSNLGHINLVKQNYETALSYLDQALEIIQVTGHVGAKALILYNLGYAKLYLGDLDAAQSSVQTALDIWESAGERKNQIKAVSLLGRIEIEWAQFGRAADYYADAEALIGTLDYPLERAEILLYRAETAYRNGEPENGRRYLDEARGIATERDIPLLLIRIENFENRLK